MSFENPQLNNLPEKNFPSIEKSEPNKGGRLKKLLGVAAIGLATLAGEKSVKGEETNLPKAPDPIVQKESRGLSQRYHEAKKINIETAKKVLEHQKKLMRGEITPQNISEDPFLKEYYWYLGNREKVESSPEYQASVEQVRSKVEGMRVLQIAFSKGIKVDLSKGLDSKIVTRSDVPVSAILNGVEISITEADYTEKEKLLINSEKNSSSPTVKGESPNKVRQSPDFDKNAEF